MGAAFQPTLRAVARIFAMDWFLDSADRPAVLRSGRG